MADEKKEKCLSPVNPFSEVYPAPGQCSFYPIAIFAVENT